MSDSGGGPQAQLNVRLRTDATPEQLLKELFLSPLIYLRLVGILFSIIVFGCVSDQVILDNNVCGYENSNACNFSIAIGVMAFLICLVFVVKDIVMVLTDFSQAMKLKMVVTLVDIAVNGFWAFMWFVSFCYTADKNRDPQGRPLLTPERNCANSGVAFSFFSLILWGVIVGLNIFFLLRMIKGRDRDSNGGGGPGGGYASFPEGQDPADGGGDDKTYSPPEY